MADTAELMAEQAYFDAALEQRERRRHHLGEVHLSAANPKDVVAFRKSADGTLRDFRPPDEAVAFGRIDIEDDTTLYIGHQTIFDTEQDALVINWKTPVGGLFYDATHEDTRGVMRRRTYQCDSNRILTFDDVVFADLASRVSDLIEPEADDNLLAELSRSRTGEMLEIVKTIQAAQNHVIREPLDQLLVVQGGPGTGKTAVALHRVSWLLYNHHGEMTPGDVLVVGPNRTFVRYIREVLPSLGDRDVRQLPLSGLGPEVRLGRIEDDEVTRLKGEARMGRLLDRGLRDRVSVPDGPLEIPVGGRRVQFEASDVQAEVDRLIDGPYGVGRQAMRNFLRRRATDYLRSRPQASGPAEVPVDAADGLLERIWPQLTAPSFVQDLLGSEGRLVGAAGDDFSAREVRVLYRRSSDRLSNEEWSIADVPLLDHAAHRIGGQSGETFRHIVIDEAQDLSPMQLASVARRSSEGSMTLLGDMAQSTGHWARDTWSDVTDALGSDMPVVQAELEIGYRVPRQVFEFAAQLLPTVAPGISPPRVVRDGRDPVLRPVANEDDRADVAVAAAMDYARLGLLVGVVCPASCRTALRENFDRQGAQLRDVAASGIGAGINVLSPSEVKGLEFDAVVVVEPELIVAEEPRGGRLLYVALTRTTMHLTVVHVGAALPLAVPSPEGPANAEGTDVSGPTSREAAHDTPAVSGNGSSDVSATRKVERSSALPRVVKLLADDLAAEVKASVAPELWLAVLEQMASSLVPEPDDAAEAPGADGAPAPIEGSAAGEGTDEAPAVVRLLVAALEKFAEDHALVTTSSSRAWHVKTDPDASGFAVYLDGSRVEMDLDVLRQHGDGDLAEELLTRIGAITGTYPKTTKYPRIDPQGVVAHWAEFFEQVLVPYFDARVRYMKSADAATLDIERVHAVLASMPQGSWTTYGQLAAATGGHPRGVASHLRSCANCPNAWRILERGGRVSPSFRWTSEQEIRSPQEILETEGVAFDNGEADPSKSLDAGALIGLVRGN